MHDVDVLDTSAAGGLIVRGGVVRFVGYIAVVVLSIVSAALLTRHLGVVRFGQYTTVISLVSIVAVITDAGMSNLGTREFAVRQGSERDALMRDLLGLRVALTLVGVVLATAFALLADYNQELVLGTIVASIATVVLVLVHTLSIPLSTELRLGTLAVLEVVRQALSVLAIVALIVVGAGVLPLLAVALAVNLILLVPSRALVRGQITLRMELRPRNWISLLRPAVAFSLATAVGTIYVYTAQILTSLVATSHQSGLFAASFRVFVVVAGVPGLLVAGALPVLARAARDDRERLHYALDRIFEVSLILGTAAAVGLFAAAPFVIEVIAGPSFAGASDVLRIQSLALIASFVLAGWSFALISLQRYAAMLIANSVAFAVSCTLTFVLAAEHGAQGAALATICGEVALAAALLVALVRDQPELRPQSLIVSKVSLAAAPGIVLALVSGLPSLVNFLLAMAIFAVLIIITRAAPRELVELLPPGLTTRLIRKSKRLVP